MRRKIFALTLILTLLAVFGSAILVMAATNYWMINIDGVDTTGPLATPGEFCAIINGSSGNAIEAMAEGPLVPLVAGQSITVSGSTSAALGLRYTDGSEYLEQLPAGGTISLTLPKDADYVIVGGEGNVIITCGSDAAAAASGDGWLFRDGRLNADTPNAPVVFWPTAEGMQVYPNNNSGIILDVNAELLASAGGAVSVNTLLWESPDGMHQLWQLSDGSYQLIGPDADDQQLIPGENILLWQSADGLMSFWMLADGTYQFNYGPDADGDHYVNTFDAMPPTAATNISYNETGVPSKW
ncbi:hypothetical protein ACFLYO_09690 [Chloroflexota bacterium]